MSIIISILFSLLHPNTHDIYDNHHLECLTDEFYPEITDGRGIAYERIGQWDKAEKDFLSSLGLK